MQRIVIIVVIVLIVLAYMATYTVRFTEKAVVTTFGRADEGAVQATPGLRFKVPYVQRVTKYDARTRFLESRPATQQTADNRQIVATAFLTWRVSDPLAFYRRFGGGGDRSVDHYREAEKRLGGQLSSAMSEISQFRLSELLSAGAGGSRLADLERNMLKRLRAGGGDSELAALGVEPVAVGISAIKFPEGTTQDVFNSMKAYRNRLAGEAIGQGRARAETIRSRATADATKITAFAERLATDIRKQGDAEAAQYLAQMSEQPELAVFLKNIDFMRESLGRKVTLVLSTAMPGLGLLRPDALNGLKPGEVPPFDPTGGPASGTAGVEETGRAVGAAVDRGDR